MERLVYIDITTLIKTHVLRFVRVHMELYATYCLLQTRQQEIVLGWYISHIRPSLQTPTKRKTWNSPRKYFRKSLLHHNPTFQEYCMSFDKPDSINNALPVDYYRIMFSLYSNQLSSFNLNAWYFFNNLLFRKLLKIFYLFVTLICPVGWGCRIHRLHHCRGVPLPRVTWIWH